MQLNKNIYHLVWTEFVHFLNAHQPLCLVSRYFHQSHLQDEENTQSILTRYVVFTMSCVTLSNMMQRRVNSLHRCAKSKNVNYANREIDKARWRTVLCARKATRRLMDEESAQNEK
jgi:hypothetical protein